MKNLIVVLVSIVSLAFCTGFLVLAVNLGNTGLFLGSCVGLLFTYWMSGPGSTGNNQSNGGGEVP